MTNDFASTPDLPGIISALASRVESLERSPRVKVVTESPINVKYPEYGAKGDGSTDNTAALAAAAAAVPSSGGHIVIPPGTYVLDTLNVDDKTNLTIEGIGSRQGGVYLVSARSSGSIVSARSTNGLTLRGVSISSNNAAFTGTVLDLSTGGLSGDTTLFHVADLELVATSTASSTVKLVNLEDSTIGCLERIWFQGGGVGVYGRSSAAHYSNSHTIRGCLFAGQDEIPIKNAYSGWRLEGNTFEPLRNGNAGALLNEVGVPCQVLYIAANWMGDVGTGLGAWFTILGDNITFIGNQIDGANAADGIKLNGAVNNLAVVCNWFNGVTDGIDFNALTVPGLVSTGNRYTSVTNPHNGAGAGINSLVTDPVASNHYAMRLRASGAGADGFQLTVGGIALFNEDVSLLRDATGATPTLASNSPMSPKSYTTATKPAANSVRAGSIIYVSDGGTGAVFQGSNGAAWVNLG